MITLEQIASQVNGTLQGDGKVQITGIETIEGARSGDLTFAIDEKLVSKLARTHASAAIVPRDFPVPEDCSLPIIQCDNAKEAFTKIAVQLRPEMTRSKTGVSPKATISPTARIGENVNVYPGAFIGDHSTIGDNTTIFPGVCIMENCTIGNDVQIFPNAVLYENSMIGDRSIIHANAVVGAFGFGYDSSSKGHKLSVQLGNVEVGSDVDIGACTTIDRGTFGTTRIGSGSKLDNQVQIGHNCQIGDHNLLCSLVGIAGSTRTGKFVVVAGQVGISDHLDIGDQTMLCAQSGVMHDLEGGQTYFGAPAIPAREGLLQVAMQAKLPEMHKDLKRIKKQLVQVESRLPSTDENPSPNENQKAA